MSATTALVAALAVLVLLVAVAGILVDIPWWVVWPVAAVALAVLIRAIRGRSRRPSDREKTEG